MVERSLFETWAVVFNGWTLEEIQQCRAGDRYLNERLDRQWQGWQGRATCPIATLSAPGDSNG